MFEYLILISIDFYDFMILFFRFLFTAVFSSSFDRGETSNTQEILARSLANFHCQWADRHMKAMRERARANDLTICYCKKQIGVSFSCVWLVIDNEFRHNICQSSVRIHSTIALLMVIIIGPTTCMSMHIRNKLQIWPMPANRKMTE